MKPSTKAALSLELTYSDDEGVVFAPAVGRQGVREIAILSGDRDDGDALGFMFAQSPTMARLLEGRMGYCERDTSSFANIDCARRRAAGINEETCWPCRVRATLNAAKVLP